MYIKRVISVLLIVALMASIVPVHAEAQVPLYSPDAFRMSDEYAEVFPNGLIEFATVQFDTFKDSDNFAVVLVRRGGTDGEVSVSLKVIETTAKYGRDFVLIDEYGKVVEKNDDTQTMLESALEDFTDDPLTSSELDEATETPEVVIPEGGDDLEETADLTEATVSVENDDSQEPGEIEEADDSEEIGTIDTADNSSEDETAENVHDANEEEAEEEDGYGAEETASNAVYSYNPAAGYASSLHKMKDEITGTQTKADTVAATGSFNLFGADTERQIEETAFMNAIYPGTSLTFHFKDGENYKAFKVCVFDNDIIESDKHFSMGLYDVTGGAALGEQLNAGCVIKGDSYSNDSVTLSFSEPEYSINETADKLTVKVKRTGNEQTYYAFDFKTMPGTAEALSHYTPVVETAVMMPGQTYKLVEIPITASGLEKPLSFELVALGDSGKDARASVTIHPAETETGGAAAAAFSTTSVTTPAPITYYYYDFSHKSQNGSTWWDDRVVDNAWTRNVFLGGGDTREAYLQLQGLDLRGIESVAVTGGTYRCESKYADRHTTAGWFSDYWGSGFWGNYNIDPMKTFTYKPNDPNFPMPFDNPKATFMVYAGSAWDNSQDTHVKTLVMYKKEFKIQSVAPDQLTAYTYDGQSVIKSEDFQPRDAITFTNENIGRPNNFFRDDTIIITPRLSAKGIEYGAKFVGYQLKNNKTGQYGPVIPGNTITLTPELISEYIFAGTFRDTLTVKPVFERESIGERALLVPWYNTNPGVLKIGDGQIATWDTKDDGTYADAAYVLNPKMSYGDSIRVYLLPRTGFNAKGLDTGEGAENSGEDTSMVDFRISKNGTLKISPRFTASNLLVSVKPNSAYAANLDKGELSIDNNLPITVGAKVGEYTMTSLSLDEVVTLAANPQEGYIACWRYDDGTSGKLANDSQYALHYGNSFSFPIRSQNTVEYGFVKAEGLTNYVLKGKVIESNGTLKNQKLDDANIDLNNSGTFQTIPDVGVAVMAAEEKSKIEVGGKTYSSTGATSQTGEFAIYVPNVMANAYFKVNCLQDDVVRSYSVFAYPGEKATSYIILPARDPDFKIKSIYSNDETGVNGAELTIPNRYNAANTTFYIATKSARAVNEVRLRSYTKEGVLLGMRSAERDGGEPSDELWTVDVNMQEFLTPGGRLSVEILDDRNVGHGEVEAGYTILKAPPEEMGIKLPGADAGANGKDMPAQPVVGGGNPTFTGSEFDVYEKDTETNGKYLDLTIGVGEIYKAAILENLKNNGGFNDLSPIEKAAFISSYIQGVQTSSAASGYSASQLKEMEAKNKNKLTQTGKLGINFSYGFYMRLERNENGTDYNFHYLFLYTGIALQVKQEVNTFIVAVPAYASFNFRLQVKGVLGMVNQRTDFSEHNLSKEFVLLLTKYGAGRETSASDTQIINQEMYQLLYTAAKMNPSYLPSSGGGKAITEADITTYHLQYVASQLNTLLADKLFYATNRSRINEWRSDARSKSKFSANLNKLMDDYGDGTSELENTSISQFNFLLIKTLANPAGTEKYIQSYEKLYYSGSDMLELGNLNWTGYSYFGINAKIGAGIGHTSVFGVGLSGSFIFDIVYQPPSEGRGTFTLGLNADIYILGINIPFRLLENTWLLFETDHYVPMPGFDVTEGSGGVILKLAGSQSIDARVLDKSIAKAGAYSLDTSPERITENTSFTPKDTLMGGIAETPIGVNGSQFAASFDEDHYMDTIKNPSPHLFSLEDGKRILFYLNDDLDRELFDGSCAYYMIYNGTSWGTPTAINDDGTYDGALVAEKLPDGRIVVCYTSLSEKLGDVSVVEVDAADMLGTQTLQVVIFDKDGIPGDVETIAPAGYACSMPSIAYNESTGQIILTFKMTDYNTAGIGFEMSAFENASIESDVGLQSFLSNSFSAVGYVLYDGGEWADYDAYDPADAPYLAYEAANGVSLDAMRFVSGIELPNYENPCITEMASAVHNGSAYIAYVTDLDKDVSTTADRDVFITVYDFDSGSFIGPVRVTDDMVENTNIHLAYNLGVFALYTGSGDSVAAYPLPDIAPSGDNSDALEEIQAVGSVYYTIKNQGSPVYILEKRSHEAAVSYTLIDGDDGNKYMLWSEHGTYTDDTENVVNKSVQNLYMSMYDEKFKSETKELEDAETITVYTGAWGNPGALTSETSFMLSQPAMIISEDGKEAVVVYKSTRIERIEESSGIYEKESDTSRMWLQEFEKVSSISHDEDSVMITPAYPREGDRVTVRFSMTNYGTMPSEKIKLEYFLVSDGSKTPTDGGKEMEQHFSTLLPIDDQLSFIMPACEESLTLEIKAWEDDLEMESDMKINIPILPKIEPIEFAAAANLDGSITVSGKVVNNGNADAEDAFVEIVPSGYADEWTALFGEGAIDDRPASKSFDIPSLAQGELYDFTYTIPNDDNIGAYYADDHTASFSLWAGCGEDVYTIATTNAKRNAPSLPVLTNITAFVTEVTNSAFKPKTTLTSADYAAMSNETETANIKTGEELAFVIALSPYDAGTGYSVEYASSNPAIVSVDPTLGTFKGLRAGQAVVTANVYKDSTDKVLLIRLDGRITDAYGYLVTDGENLTERSFAERELVASRELTVKVSGNSGGNPTPDPTPAPSPESKSETPEPVVTIDGKEVDAGTIETKGYTTIFTVNQSALQKQLEAATSNLTFVIPSETGATIVQLVVQNVDDMASKDMTLKIQVGNVQYELPATAIDTASILAALGAENAADVPISITITTEMSAAAQAAVKAALENSTELVLPPMEYKITATYNGQTVEITTFNQYVSRTIEVKAEQADRITTAIVVDPDGTTRHVPTRVYQQNGKWYTEVSSLTNSVYAFVSNAKTFTDASGKWYESTVNEMGSRMIISGVGNNLFAGERDITRAEFAAIIIRSLGIPSAGNGAVFTDVSRSAWYYGVVGTAYEYGLVAGVGNNQFAPDRKITRQEAMLMVQRAAKLAGFTGSTGSLDAFADSEKVSDWALGAARWNVGSGLIVGSGGKLNPLNNITRAETATLVLKFMQKAGLVDVRTKF